MAQVMPPTWRTSRVRINLLSASQNISIATMVMMMMLMMVMMVTMMMMLMMMLVTMMTIIMIMVVRFDCLGDRGLMKKGTKQTTLIDYDINWSSPG